MTDEVIESGENAVEAAAPAESQVVQQEAQQETTVPLAALQAERRDRQRLQEEMMALKMSVEQMKRVPEDTSRDDDVLTYGEHKKSLQKIQQDYQMSIEELKMTQKHPDYLEMIQQYLPEVLEEKPYLKTTLIHDPNKFQLAYDLAKTAQSYVSKKKEVKKTKDAEKILENQNHLGSLSSVGHSTSTKSPSHYKSMSDADFKALVAKNMGYA